MGNLLLGEYRAAACGFVEFRRRCAALIEPRRLEPRNDLVSNTVAAAQANPRITVVTVAGADHNIHRGRFAAFMAEVEPFLG